MNKSIQWILKIGVSGEFLGHGLLALQGKAAWVGWIVQILSVDRGTATILLTLIGAFDVLVAILVFVYPFRLMLLWAALWGFWTALIRPIVGESFLDFVERFPNWAAPLALLFFRGLPKNTREWFK